MMPEMLTHGFMQRAFLSGLLSASALSLVGVYIVLKRMSNIGEGLSQMAFAGIAVGILAGLAPMPFALAAAFIGVLLIQYMKGAFQVYGEAAVQILCAGGFALGVVLVSASSGFNVNLMSYLFGSLLSVNDGDLMFIAALTAVTFITIAWLNRKLTYIAFDEESARVAGLPVDRLNLLLLFLTAVSVVAGMKVVGILLVSSLLVVPAAAAIHLARSFRQTIILSVAYAMTSVIVGLTLAYYLNLAAGGTVALTQVVLFFATLALAKKG